MADQYQTTKTEFVLPTAVEALRVSWLATFQSAGTVSALLCGIEAGLLVFFKDDANFGAKSSDPEWNQTTMQKAILSLTYISLILSLGATVASYVLTAEFSTLPVRAAKDSLHTCSPATAVRMPDWDILRHYHLKPCAGRVWFYWILSLMLAVVFTVLSIALFAASQEDMEIKVAVLVFVGLFAFAMVDMITAFRGE